MTTGFRRILLPALLVATAFCSCSGPKDKSLLLKDWNSVFVPLAPATLTSLQSALDEKGIGNVMSSDMKLVFQYVDSTFKEGAGPGAIVYSDIHGVPPGSMYIEMRVWQCYEAVLADTNALGIHVNYDVSGKNAYTVSKAELQGAIDKLPRQEKLPMDISITQ